MEVVTSSKNIIEVASTVSLSRQSSLWVEVDATPTKMDMWHPLLLVFWKEEQVHVSLAN